MLIHKSKIDKWLYALVIGILGLPLIMGLIEGVLVVPGLVVCGLTAAFILWLYAATKYVITDDTLIIHAGLYKVEIPVNAITSITDSRNPLASPAFSLDRLEIKYGADKTILISPKDKAAFLADLGWLKG